MAGGIARREREGTRKERNGKSGDNDARERSTTENWAEGIWNGSQVGIIKSYKVQSRAGRKMEQQMEGTSIKQSCIK